MTVRMLACLVLLCAALGAGAQDVPMKTTIKGLNQDDWPDKAEIAGNETGWVAVLVPWYVLVGDDDTATHYANVANCTAPDVRYDGYGVTECFRYGTLSSLDGQVRGYAQLGVRVIAIVVGVPNYARIADSSCQADGNTDPSAEIFCAASSSATDTKDGTPQHVTGATWLKIASRFLGHRYGTLVRGWVIMNEVNSADWFRAGCHDCSGAAQVRWLDLYAASFNNAYDGITDGYADLTAGAAGDALERLDGSGERTMPVAPVMASMAGFFDTPWDTARTGGYVRQMSEKTLLRGLDARAAGRAWRVAQHAYPRDIWVPVMNADDLTRAGTSDPHDAYASDFGGASPPPGARGVTSAAAIGAVVGFLRAEFPSRADVWRIYMTEGGLNTNKPAWAESEYPEVTGMDFETLQWQRLCDSFGDYTGTPGIEAFTYHRMQDNAGEGGLALGLHRLDGSAKPAWTTFALANRYRSEGVPPPSCGFESLPYTRVQRANFPPQGHRISSRPLDPSRVEATWYLFRDERPGSRMLYECWMPNGHTFATAQANCDGRAGSLNLGPIGFAYTPDNPRPADDPGQWVQLYACSVAGVDDIVTADAACEGHPPAAALGWARLATSNADDTKYVLLRRAARPAGPPYGIPEHWITTVVPPPGFTQEPGTAWWILREPAPGTKLYFECEVGGHSFPSAREDCEHTINRGPLGYIPQTGTVPLYRCGFAGMDHMVSTRADCEGFYTNEGLLGYAAK